MTPTELYRYGEIRFGSPKPEWFHAGYRAVLAMARHGKTFVEACNARESEAPKLFQEGYNDALKQWFRDEHQAARRKLHAST